MTCIFAFTLMKQKIKQQKSSSKEIHTPKSFTSTVHSDLNLNVGLEEIALCVFKCQKCTVTDIT